MNILIKYNSSNKMEDNLRVKREPKGKICAVEFGKRPASEEIK